MNPFQYKSGELYAEEVALNQVVLETPTPFYLYSHAALREQFRRFDQAFNGADHLVCYSMKANSNLAVLKTFINEGSGIDVVTGGELHRALKAGCSPQKIVFSGVGKSPEEMRAALQAGILQFNIESEPELDVLSDIALSLGKKAPVALRVNPDVDPKTHPYISTGLKKSKFGVNHERALEIYRKAKGLKGIEIVGIDCHIGSQLTSTEPFMEALRKIKGLILELSKAGIKLANLDIGGGLGVTYKDETPPSPEDYAKAVLSVVGDLGLRLLMEPGRFLVANAGLIVTKVLFDKKGDTKRFVIVDVASNDLMRPALYGSYHAIRPLKEAGERPTIVADVVGPICETGDFLAQDRQLPEVKAGEFLAIFSAGAYGFSMSSTYNSRPRVAELMVRGSEIHVVREAETIEDITKNERCPEFLL